MIRLTETGWQGASSGRWSPAADSVLSRRGGISLDGRTIADTLAGDDQISSRSKRGAGVRVAGSLLMSEGRDLLTGLSKRGEGVVNDGVIDLGDGDDQLIAGGRRFGIKNAGAISMGKGDDAVRIGRGGIQGEGYIALGKGNDQLQGFGRHRIYGEAGTDTSLLQRGRYTIELSDCGCSFVVSRGKTAMALYDFERIGGIGGSNTLKLKEGTLAIGANGNASYL